MQKRHPEDFFLMVYHYKRDMDTLSIGIHIYQTDICSESRTLV